MVDPERQGDIPFHQSDRGIGVQRPGIREKLGGGQEERDNKGSLLLFKPGVPAEKQFSNFKRSVILEHGDLPPVLDVERKECDMHEVNKWLDLAERHYGVKPIVYSGCLFFKVLMDGRIDKRYPLWLYVDGRFKMAPDFNDYDCLFWQFNQSGGLKGVKGDVDMNLYVGDGGSFDGLLVK